MRRESLARHVLHLSPALVMSATLGIVGVSSTTREGRTMDAITTDFWEVVLWSCWFFIWVAAIVVWVRCLFDLFGDVTLSGWGKAGWAAVLIFVPWLGALIYLVVRGSRMTERRHPAGAADQQASSARADPAELIRSARSLLDAGAISQAEYDEMKAKALA
jgi:hypothetical protein